MQQQKSHQAPEELSPLKQKLYSVIFNSDTRGGRLFDIVLLWLILLSVVAVSLESVAAFRNAYGSYIHFAEWFFTACFTIEYLLRIYCSPRRLKYIFSFYGMIDLLSFLPIYLSLAFASAQYLIVIRSIRLLRVFRIFKLSRFLSEGNILTTALKASRYKIVVFLTSVLTVVAIVGTLMYIIEGEQSGFTSIPVSIYWAIVTITTVGYGDISPQSPLGQLLASFLMVIGYGILAVPTGIVSVEIAKATHDAKAKCPSCHAAINTDQANYCSNCGKELPNKTS
jgi:voltage-gated potassium channel